MSDVSSSNVASNQEIQESNITLIKTIKNYLASKDYKFYVVAEEDAEVEEFEKYSTEQITALPRENYQKAIKLYTQAIAFNQDDPIFYSNRAACYYNINEYLRVIDDCNSALEMDPCYVKALNRRAMAYEQTARYEESLHDFTAACIIGEFKNENAAASIDRLLKKVASIKAKEIIKYSTTEPVDQNAEANSEPENINSVQVSDLDSENHADNLFDAAERFLRQQRYEEAMNANGKAINLGCTKMAKALNLRGTFTNLMGDSRSALADFQKALDLKPDYVQLYVKRATIYTEQDPDFIFAYIQLAIAQYKSGSVEDGMKTFQLGLQKFPKSAEMHNYYGELLADQRRIDEAIEQFDKANELQTGNFALPLVNKAMLYLHVKGDSNLAEDHCRNLEEALQCLEKYQEVARTEAELQGLLEYAE
ncbi:5687_t:CDS:2, partial [Racocetra fulgida]